MKNLLIPTLALAALGSANVAFGATFLNDSSNLANDSQPWTYGYQFQIPTGGYFVISDIQVFDVKAGNTLRVGLWANSAPNGYGNSIFQTTRASTGDGVLNPSGYVSLSSGAIHLTPGTYTLSASGFNLANSIGDSTVGPPFAGTTTYLNPGDFAGSIVEFVAINTDPTFNNPANIGLNIPPGSNRWKSVNFTYTPVPEPETYAMVAGAALVGFGLWRRRQSK